MPARSLAQCGRRLPPDVARASGRGASGLQNTGRFWGFGGQPTLHLHSWGHQALTLPSASGRAWSVKLVEFGIHQWNFIGILLDTVQVLSRTSVES